MKSLLCSPIVRMLAFAAGVVAFLPAFAPAQDFVGKFTLPYEAYWGQTLLSPGEYSYSLESTGPSARLLVRKSTGSSGFMVMARSCSSVEPSATSELKIRQQGADRFITSLYLGEVGEILHFDVANMPAELAKGDSAVRTAAMSPPTR
jgi:hypothetical protein